CERLMATDAETVTRWLLASRRGRRLRRDDGHVDGAVGLERKSLGVWWWLVWESQSETLQEDDWVFGWLVWWWMVLGHGGWWWFASSVCVCVVVL
ncbi:hypothetical protein PIB30_104844, partial [Stylosanthes scabra]|nr:hypothetical protein [Stylosanthes scabra]